MYAASHARARARNGWSKKKNPTWRSAHPLMQPATDSIRFLIAQFPSSFFFFFSFFFFSPIRDVGGSAVITFSSEKATFLSLCFVFVSLIAISSSFGSNQVAEFARESTNAIASAIRRRRRFGRKVRENWRKVFAAGSSGRGACSETRDRAFETRSKERRTRFLGFWISREPSFISHRASSSLGALNYQLPNARQPAKSIHDSSLPSSSRPIRAICASDLRASGAPMEERIRFLYRYEVKQKSLSRKKPRERFLFVTATMICISSPRICTSKDRLRFFEKLAKTKRSARPVRRWTSRRQRYSGNTCRACIIVARQIA